MASFHIAKQTFCKHKHIDGKVVRMTALFIAEYFEGNFNVPNDNQGMTTFPFLWGW